MNTHVDMFFARAIVGRGQLAKEGRKANVSIGLGNMGT